MNVVGDTTLRNVDAATLNLSVPGAQTTTFTPDTLEFRMTGQPDITYMNRFGLNSTGDITGETITSTGNIVCDHIYPDGQATIRRVVADEVDATSALLVTGTANFVNDVTCDKNIIATGGGYGELTCNKVTASNFTANNGVIAVNTIVAGNFFTGGEARSNTVKCDAGGEFVNLDVTGTTTLNGVVCNGDLLATKLTAISSVNANNVLASNQVSGNFLVATYDCTCETIRADEAVVEGQIAGGNGLFDNDVKAGNVLGHYMTHQLEHTGTWTGDVSVCDNDLSFANGNVTFIGWSCVFDTTVSGTFNLRLGASPNYWYIRREGLSNVTALEGQFLDTNAVGTETRTDPYTVTGSIVPFKVSGGNSIGSAHMCMTIYYTYTAVFMQ